MQCEGVIENMFVGYFSAPESKFDKMTKENGGFKDPFLAKYLV